MASFLYVFSYDISSARIRRRVAARLEDVAVRVQGSVFETRLDPAAARKLAEDLSEQLEPGDSLKVYALGNTGINHSMSFGAALPPLSGSYVLA